MMNDIFANQKKCDINFKRRYGIESGVILYDFPIIENPSKNYTKHKVAGREGILIIDDETTDNLKITCTFSIYSNQFNRTVRNLKRWLRGKGKLYFTEDTSFYYDVLFIELGEIEREIRQYGRFTVIFHCFPYEFSIDGDTAKPAGKLVNIYDKSMPVYKIKGEGVCTLTVNGNEMKANVGQNITIDTRRMIAYREDGTFVNTEVVGRYDELYLNAGENTVSISSGFELEVFTKWGIKA